MRKSNSFRPTSLDSLESRIALSGAGLGSLAGARGAEVGHVSDHSTEKAHHAGAEQGTTTHAHQAHHHTTHHHHGHKAPR